MTESRPVLVADLTVSGAVFTSLAVGALAGALMIALLGVYAARAAFWSADSLPLLAIGAVWGGVEGVLIGPPIGVLLLRDAPLGRAIGWALGGSVAGGLMGWRVRPGIGAFLGAAAGLLVAALLLRPLVRDSRDASRPAI